MAKRKGTYVDGFVLIVPKKNIAAYRNMARAAGRVWRKHGALDYKECIGDDLHPKGVTFPFTKMARAKKGETVFFSYIVYASRAHRDRVNAKVMKDPFMNDSKYKNMPMPFDMNRMAFGGFRIVADA